MKQIDLRCRMEYVYRDRERQGSMGRAHRDLCEPIENLANLSQLRDCAQKDARRTVAFLRLRV
jgi:hypothetical protein